MDFNSARELIQEHLTDHPNQVLSRLMPVLYQVRELETDAQYERIFAFFAEEKEMAESSPEAMEEFTDAHDIFSPYLDLYDELAAIDAEYDDDVGDEFIAPTATYTAGAVKTSIPVKKFLAKNIAATIFSLIFVACVFAGGMYITGELVLEDGGIRVLERVITMYGDEDIFFVSVSGTARATDIYGNVWDIRGLGDPDTPPTIVQGANTTIGPREIIDDIAFYAISSTSSEHNIAEADIHTLGLDAEGNLWGFGSNSQGQLGDGTTQDRPSPTRIETDATFVRLFTYRRNMGGGPSSFSLAMCTDGDFWAWGAHQGYAAGFVTTPTRYRAGYGFVHMSRHFALSDSGEVWSKRTELNDAGAIEHAFTRIDLRPSFVYMSSQSLVCTDGMLWQLDHSRDAGWFVRRFGR